MGIATRLLRAEPIGVKELKTHLSAVLKKRKARVVTDHNQPRHFLIPYEEMVELAEMVEELSDASLISQVAEGRVAYGKGKSRPLEGLAKKLNLIPRARTA